jgi:hypothetical protein
MSTTAPQTEFVKKRNLCNFALCALQGGFLQNREYSLGWPKKPPPPSLKGTCGCSCENEASPIAENNGLSDFQTVSPLWKSATVRKVCLLSSDEDCSISNAISHFRRKIPLDRPRAQGAYSDLNTGRASASGDRSNLALRGECPLLGGKADIA